MSFTTSNGTIGYVGTTPSKICDASNSGKSSVKLCNVQATVFVGAGTTGASDGAFPLLNNTTVEFSGASGLYVIGTANGTLNYFMEYGK